MLAIKYYSFLKNVVSSKINSTFSSQYKFLRDFFKPHFDSRQYLDRNPDVQQAGLNPLAHWLSHGVWEGRIGAPSLEIEVGQQQGSALGWTQLVIGNKSISVRLKPDRTDILDQIIEQFKFETTVLSAGGLALNNLRTYRGGDLLARDGIKISSLFEGLPEKVGVLVATPMLVAGGAEKYVVDWVSSLEALGHGPVVVVVTEQTRQQAQGWEQLKILAPLKGNCVKFWSDDVLSGVNSAAHFAHFTQALRPKVLIANNSRLALDAIVRFGRGLSYQSRLYCTYFSISPMGLGAPFGARYPTLTCLHATSVTDNEALQKNLVEQTGAIPGTRVALLPPLAHVLPHDQFQKRLESRRAQNKKASQRRWVWLSRVEPAKGTAILRRIAQLMPRDQFDVFGPLEPNGRCHEELQLPNVELRGLVADVTAADFTAYNGFLFTSFFEGMPNVVLEMTQHAIPMVIADVGGLSHTFKEGSVLFVQHEKEIQRTADRFAATLEKLAAMTLDEVERMAHQAYECVESRHSAVAHRAAVVALLETECA
jgi:glycosyltransferase involved in cell wall biosynthesis